MRGYLFTMDGWLLSGVSSLCHNIRRPRSAALGHWSAPRSSSHLVYTHEHRHDNLADSNDSICHLLCFLTFWSMLMAQSMANASRKATTDVSGVDASRGGIDDHFSNILLYVPGFVFSIPRRRADGSGRSIMLKEDFSIQP